MNYFFSFDYLFSAILYKCCISTELLWKQSFNTDIRFCLVHLMYKIRLNSDLSLWNDTTTSYSSKMFQPSHKTEKSDFHCFNYQIQYLVGCTVAIKTKRPTLESFQPFIGQIQHVIIALNIIGHSICLKIPLRH